MRAHDLDDLLAQARAEPAQPSAALLARVEADALALQPRPAARKARPHKGLWAALSEALGGRGALAGLGSAVAAGLIIGFVQPAPLVSVTGALWPDPAVEAVDLLPDVTDFLSEG